VVADEAVVAHDQLGLLTCRLAAADVEGQQSAVPGSPIDCAAMTPTSPMLTMRPRARSSVAARADAAPRLAGEHRPDLDVIDVRVLDELDLVLVDLCRSQ
jgi:hypothetical protein